MGDNGGWSFPGKGRISAANFFVQVAAGNVPGFEAINVVGQNDNVSATALDDLSQIGVTNIPVPASAIAMEIVSTSVLDSNPAGANARTVELIMLDTGFAERPPVTVALNGLTPVPVPGTMLRINGMQVQTNGGHGVVAAGNIILRAAGGGTEYARIAFGGNVMLQAHYTVPIDKMALVLGWSSGMSTRAGRLLLRITRDRWTGALLPGVFHFHDALVVNDNGQIHHFFQPFLIPAMADIKISAQGTGPVGGVASGGLEITVFNSSQRVSVGRMS